MQLADAMDDIRTMLYNTRVTRDAFFDYMFYAAKNNERLRGSERAREDIQRWCDESIKYLHDIFDAQNRMDATNE